MEDSKKKENETIEIRINTIVTILFFILCVFYT